MLGRHVGEPFSCNMARDVEVSTSTKCQSQGSRQRQRFQGVRESTPDKRAGSGSAQIRRAFVRLSNLHVRIAGRTSDTLPHVIFAENRRSNAHRSNVQSLNFKVLNLGFHVRGFIGFHIFNFRV